MTSPSPDASPDPFATLRLPVEPTVTAPDGSFVRVLLALPGGSMAHFELPPGAVTVAVRHRTVEELWFVLSGAGRLWRESPDGDQAQDELTAGTCVSIPVGTSFQFRCNGSEPLRILGVTMPPWPGPDEAVPVDGLWPPAVP